ncbi:MAG TPA: DMT family transporter [Burkholderiaceae bacterium]|nr:DMT family transporter [Burkholderiaceae bacterium]
MSATSSLAVPGSVIRGRGGVAFIFAAVACFGALDTSSKIAASAVPVVMAVWVRYLTQAVVTGVVLWPRQRSALFRTGKPGLQFLRAVLLVASNALAFLSLAHMHVGEFTAIVMLTPLLLTVVAALALRERVSWRRWACVGGGFAGTLLVMRPGQGIFQLVLLLPLFLVVVSTAFQLLTSALAKVDSPGTIHFYSGLGGLALTTVALPFAWRAQPVEMWMVMGLMGVLGTLGHFFLIVAYTRAPVATLTPYLYLQIPFAALGGWLVFKHVPDAWSLWGIGTIFACGVFGTWLTGRELLYANQDEAQSSVEAIAGADVR